MLRSFNINRSRMRSSGATIVLTVCSLVFSASTHAQINAATELRITALMKQMSLEEKIGQMAQVAIDRTGKADYAQHVFNIDQAQLDDVVIQYKAGSILNTPPGILLDATQWNDVIRRINESTAKTRLKIPVLYGLDQIHGASYVKGFTSFPQEIGQAATWNPLLVKEGARITAYESRAAGVPYSFSPVLDLGTNPVWPRIWEGFGEDPYLIAEMGTAYVNGAQDPLGDKNKVAVSLKHFMGYSDPKYGKDRTNAWIPEHYLREYHLPPFAAAVKAGARTVMVNSALINGMPSHMNKHLLTDILKKELGFTGFIITDWQDVENVAKRDKIAKDNKEALMLCINAGIDMSMIPYNYEEFYKDLLALVKEGKVTQARIDDAVRRILRVKYELGLFTTPLTTANNYPEFGSAAFTKAAYNTAAESITLLKNTQGVLPLARSSKILVTGPNANSMRTLNGGWTYTWQGDRTDEIAGAYNTILESLSNEFGKENVSYIESVVYKKNARYWADTVISLAAAREAAANTDRIILCLGENSYTETPGNTNELDLSPNQVALAKEMIATGKPVILILNEGRPRIISSIEPGMAAIVHVYLPGNYGGDALADILSGDVNPSGKLPITYPRFSNSLTPYIHKYSDQIANPQGAYDYSADFNPQYPFGFGLSYTTFKYDGLTVDKKNAGPTETINISVKVTNTGTRAGKEVVQLFSSDLIASLSPDVKRLRRFAKVELQAGESKVVKFTLPVSELAFVNEANQKVVEAGAFSLQVAELSTSINVTKSAVVLR